MVWWVAGTLQLTRLRAQAVAGEYFCDTILAQKCVTFGPSTKCLNEFFPFCLVPPLDPETLGGLGLGPLPLG
jgi:hypothetical protein